MILATWIALAVYASITLFFVIRGSKKTKDIKAYALGSFNFSPSFVGLSLAASITSAATFIINPGLIGKYGISGFISYGLVLPLAASISLVLLTKGFRKFGSGAMTLGLAQWIGKRYESKSFGFFFACLSILHVSFIVLICVGITQVLSKAVGIDPVYALIGIIIFIFGYMMFGGANSMVYTNSLQAFLKVIVAVLLLFSGYHYFSDGIHGFLEQLESIDAALVQATNPESYLFRDFFEIFFCQMVVGAAVVCQPHIITKSLLLKEEKDVNRFLFVSVAVQLLFFLVVIAGLYARLTFPDMTHQGEAIRPDSLMSTYVVTRFPVYITLVMVLGLIASGTSTLESLIQAISSTVTTEIILPVASNRFGKIFSPSQQIAINKSVIVALALISFVLSYQQIVSPNLSVAIFAQTGVYAFFSAAFVPVLFGMFFKEVPKQAPILASVTALVVHFGIYYFEITPYMDAPVKNPAISSALAIVSSVIIGFIVFMLKKKIRVI